MDTFVVVVVKKGVGRGWEQWKPSVTEYGAFIAWWDGRGMQHTRGKLGIFMNFQVSLKKQDVRYKKVWRGHAMLAEDGSTHSYPLH